MAQAKHPPYYYWHRMCAEFKGAKGCSVRYSFNRPIEEHAMSLTLQYHDTDVASWNTDTGAVTLNHGGWLTYYTKERINRFLEVLDLPCRVYQHQKVWYVGEEGSAREWDTLEDGENHEFVLTETLTKDVAA